MGKAAQAAQAQGIDKIVEALAQVSVYAEAYNTGGNVMAAVVWLRADHVLWIVPGGEGYIATAGTLAQWHGEVDVPASQVREYATLADVVTYADRVDDADEARRPLAESVEYAAALVGPTFTCSCGDYEHPVTPGDDDSVWCECGLRLDSQRDALDDLEA